MEATRTEEVTERAKKVLQSEDDDHRFLAESVLGLSAAIEEDRVERQLGGELSEATFVLLEGLLKVLVDKGVVTREEVEDAGLATISTESFDGGGIDL